MHTILIYTTGFASFYFCYCQKTLPLGHNANKIRFKEFHGTLLPAGLAFFQFGMYNKTSQFTKN